MNGLEITILDAATLGGDMDISVFERFGEVASYPLTARDEVEERVSETDICIVNKVKMDEAVLKNAKNLKLICVTATGYDNIDIAYCRERGITVCNVAGYSVNSVSQLTLAMVLSASVNLDIFKKSVTDGSYTKGGVQNILTPVFHELDGKTWGIIGYGAIGKKVGMAAEALGCRVIANKRTPVSEIECVDIETLLRESDIITVHVPLSNETRGMIGEKEIAMMKDGVFLVNVARGAVLDEKAVSKAVKSGKFGFFGCDVYSVEPMEENHPYQEIKDFENVCLTPHMAWGAFESRRRCLDEICKNIEAFLKGEKRNVVS